MYREYHPITVFGGPNDRPDAKIPPKGTLVSVSNKMISGRTIAVRRYSKGLPYEFVPNDHGASNAMVQKMRQTPGFERAMDDSMWVLPTSLRRNGQ